jgi:hypothetical protein
MSIATLRLISLVNKSEQSGIQSLGPDNVAIWKIRVFSLSLAITIPLIGLIVFQSIPGNAQVLS